MKKTKTLWSIFIALLLAILTIVLILILISPCVKFKSKNIVRDKNQLTYVLQPNDIKDNKNRFQEMDINKLYGIKFGKTYEVNGNQITDNKFTFDLLSENNKIVINGIVYTKEYDLKIDTSNFLKIKTDDGTNPFSIIPKSEVTLERLKNEISNFDDFFWFKDKNKTERVNNFNNIDFDFLYGFNKQNFKNIYKVEHYYENLGSGYLHTFEMHKGILGDTVTANRRNVEGFTFDEENTENLLTGVVNKDDNLVLKVYYKRNRYNVTFNLNGGIAPSIGDIEGIKHGDTIDQPNAIPYKAGYKFKYFALNGEKYEFTNIITSNIVLDAVYEAKKDTLYKVEHYFENINDDNFSKETVVLQGTTNTNVTAQVESREGFVFDAANPLNVTQGVIAADGSLELKLYYKRNRYNVTFNLDGGSPQIPAINDVKHGNTINQPETTPLKEGYKFKYFALNGEKYEFKNIITSNIVLDAVYETKKDTLYKVEHYFENINDDNFSKESILLQGETNTNVTAQVESREGFVFDAANPLNVTQGVIAADGSLELKLYYKRNRYNVTFNLDGGSPQIPAINDVKHGKLLEQPSEIPNKTGFIFKHFEFEGNEFLFSTPITRTIELKAVYEPATNTPYKVTHYYEHMNDDEHTFIYEMLQGVTGTTVLAQVKNVEGLTFDDTNVNNIKKGVIAADGSLELKLYYKRNRYNVTFNLDGGTPQIPAINDVKHGKLLEQPSEFPNKTGYIFKHFEFEGNEFLFTTPVTKTMELKAVYEPATNTQYKVTHYYENINNNEYTAINETLQGVTDTTVLAQVKNVEGLTFDDTNVNNIKQGVIAADGSLELKLYYKRNRYNVTFNLDGGTQPAITDLVVKHGQLITEPTENPTKIGYTFKEYNDGTDRFLFTTPITKHTNLVAKYIPNNDTKYTVEKYFENMDDENYEQEILTLQGTTDQNIVAEIENRPGFEFESENPLNVTQGIIAADESLVLRLHYRRKRYNVTFDLQGLIENNPETQSLKHGQLATQPDIASTINGGIIKGWSLKGGQRDIVDEDKFDFTRPVEDNLKLFVIYEHVFTQNNYPQTLVKDPELIQTLNTRVPFVVSITSTYFNGNFFGTEKVEYVLNQNVFYEKFNDKYYKYEPIEWETNGTISWSKYILDHQIYGVFIRKPDSPTEVYDTNDWDKSYMQKFLANVVNVRTVRSDFRLFTYDELRNSSIFANNDARKTTSTEFAEERSKTLGNRVFNTNADIVGFPLLNKYWTMSPTLPPLKQSHAWYVNDSGVLTLEAAGINRMFGVRFVKDNN